MLDKGIEKMCCETISEGKGTPGKESRSNGRVARSWQREATAKLGMARLSKGEEWP